MTILLEPSLMYNTADIGPLKANMTLFYIKTFLIIFSNLKKHLYSHNTEKCWVLQYWQILNY